MAYTNSQTVTGLGTTTLPAVPTTGRYAIEGKITLPLISQGAGKSSVVAVVNVNGTPVYTGGAGAEGFRVAPFCNAADVISIVLSSSAAADLGLNIIKATITASDSV